MESGYFVEDNLSFLRRLDEESVDLVCTDPPYNTGRVFDGSGKVVSCAGSFKDSFGYEDVYEEDARAVYQLCPAAMSVVNFSKSLAGEDMYYYLLYLAPRVVEIKRVLAANGSVSFHTDCHRSHYVRLLLDAVFGVRAYRNEIVWKRHFFKKATRKFGVEDDRIFWYSKGQRPTFNVQYGPLSKAAQERYKKLEDGRVCRDTGMTAPGVDPKRMFAWKGYTPHRNWQYSKEKMDLLYDQGLVVLGRKGPRLLVYKESLPQRPLMTVWTDCAMQTNAKERCGYPTQKPLKLYSRIVKALSNEGDLVLDPFAGSGTTLVAAQEAGRRWVGVDISEEARKAFLSRTEES